MTSKYLMHLDFVVIFLNLNLYRDYDNLFRGFHIFDKFSYINHLMTCYHHLVPYFLQIPIYISPFIHWDNLNLIHIKFIFRLYAALFLSILIPSLFMSLGSLEFLSIYSLVFLSPKSIFFHYYLSLSSSYLAMFITYSTFPSQLHSLLSVPCTFVPVF